MNPRGFFGELKRRNVYKVAVAYAVVTWLVIQVASIILATFEAPPWILKVVILGLIIAFPVALVFAWALELTPEGLKRTEDVDLTESMTHRTGRKLDFLIIGVLLVVIGVLIFQRLHPTAPSATSNIPEKSIAVLPFENLSRAALVLHDRCAAGYFQVEALLDPLRGDPRFEALVAKIFAPKGASPP